MAAAASWYPVGIIFITAPIAAHLVGRSAYRASGIELRLDADDDLEEAIDEQPDR